MLKLQRFKLTSPLISTPAQQQMATSKTTETAPCECPNCDGSSVVKELHLERYQYPFASVESMGFSGTPKDMGPPYGKLPILKIWEWYGNSMGPAYHKGVPIGGPWNHPRLKLLKLLEVSWMLMVRNMC